MSLEMNFVSTFLRLHKTDFDYFQKLCSRISYEAFWMEPQQGNSMANILYHIIEMESFWIDWGFNDMPFDRNRQQAFDRKKDVAPLEMSDLLQERFEKTQQIVLECSAETWKIKKKFHGDYMDKESMLHWHIHHLGIHFGHLQILERVCVPN